MASVGGPNGGGVSTAGAQQRNDQTIANSQAQERMAAEAGQAEMEAKYGKKQADTAVGLAP